MKSVELARCGRVAIEECMRVRTGEQVLVVTDTMREQSITEALLGAARSAGADAMAIVFPVRTAPGQSEPPQAVTEAMKAADAVFLHTTASLTHSQARIQAQQGGTRVISMPGVSEAGFLRTLSVDMDELVGLTNKLAQRLGRAKSVHLTTELGSDVTFGMGNPLTVADGVCANPGELDFFPPGLILIVPPAGEASGTAVIDGSITTLGRLSNPVTVRFDGYRAAAIEGGSEARRLRQTLDGFADPTVYAFAAWGVGTNRGARLLGDDPSFEGERIFGWAHVSTGSNAALPGGTVRSKIHLDAILSNPSLEADGDVILRDGQYLL